MLPTSQPGAPDAGAYSSDKMLIDRVCLDDEGAVSELLKTRCGFVIRYLVRQFNYENALYLHLKEDDWRRLRTWEGRSSLNSWMKQVAVRLCMKAKRETSTLQTMENLDTVGATLLRTADTDAKIRRIDLVRAIRELPDREREFIIRHIFEGRSIDELMEGFGLTRTNADVIKHRATKQLREILVGRGKNE